MLTFVLSKDAGIPSAPSPPPLHAPAPTRRTSTDSPLTIPAAVRVQIRRANAWRHSAATWSKLTHGTVCNWFAPRAWYGSPGRPPGLRGRSDSSRASASRAESTAGYPPSPADRVPATRWFASRYLESSRMSAGARDTASRPRIARAASAERMRRSVPRILRVRGTLCMSSSETRLRSTRAESVAEPRDTLAGS